MVKIKQYLMKATSLLVLPISLFACAKEKGITYDLLWDTKISKLESNIVVQEKNNNGITTICKKVNGEIQDKLNVLVFTDFHLDHKREICNYTYTMIAKNIMNVKPDLVLLCGDNITSIENVARAKQFAQLMEDLNVYWSFVLGNHEGKEYPEKDMMSRPEQINLFSQYKHCLVDPSVKKTSDGTVVWGDGNHAINILNSKGEVAQTFFFLDSGTIMSDEDEIKFNDQIDEFKRIGKADPGDDEFYDYIKDSQIKWYKEVMAKYPISNSTVFSHVPLKDMEDAYLTYYNAYINDKGIENKIGIGKDNKGIWPYTIEINKIPDCKVDMLTGRRAEDMCYSPHDLVKTPNGHTMMYNAMIESGGQHPAFFCGHDHQNDFVFDETVTTQNGNKIITMGYIEPACYSSNNFWTKGLLEREPFYDVSKYHLIQGYSLMNFDLNKPSTPFSIHHYTNYNVWNGAHYSEAIQLIQEGKGTSYMPAFGLYPQDPNNPFIKK